MEELVVGHHRSGRSLNSPWRSSPIGQVPSDKSYMQDVWDRMEHGLRKAEGSGTTTGDHSPTVTVAPTMRTSAMSSSTKRPPPRCQVPFWFAVAAPIIFCFLVVCTTRLVLASSQYKELDERANDAFQRANQSQTNLSRSLYRSNTRLLYRLVLRRIRDEVTQYVIELPDRAVDGLWTHMLTDDKFRGRLSPASYRDRRQLGFAMWREISSHNALRPDLIERADGLMIAFDDQAFTGVLPYIAEQAHIDVSPEQTRRTWSWYSAPPAPPGANTSDITVWHIDPVGDLEEPPRSLQPGLTTDQTFYQVQERLQAKYPEGELVQAWSGIHDLFGSQVMVSWTSPVAYCGNYSCMEGVLAASFTLASLNRWCNNSWTVLVRILANSPYENPNIGHNNSAIFVVQQDSDDYHINQEGLCLGASSGIPVGNMDELKQAIAADHWIIRATSQMILRKYGEWNATELQAEADPFAFRVLSNGDLEQLDDEYEPVESEGTFEVATLSLEIDHRTRWLVVLVLPVGAFSAELQNTRKEVEETVEHSMERLRSSFRFLHFFNVATFAVMVLCSFVLGLGLSSWVSRDLQALSRYMRKLGSLDFSADCVEFQTLLWGRRSAISDISEIQDSFCRLAQSVRTFARFVPESVVRNIVRGNERALRLHVDRRIVTVMFSDIKGFTTIAETLSQTDLLVVLTRYLTVMTQLVEFFGGVVTEILGDGVLAFWNTPDTIEKHATKACSAALAMQKALDPLNAELEAMGLPHLAIRIGLHTGTVLSGNLGSETKMKFGCMGDAVNLASRLEGLCKNFDAGILCSGETQRSAEGIMCRSLDLVQVKGKTEPTLVCEVLGRDCPIAGGEPQQPVVTEEQKRHVEMYEEALHAYQAADFGRASSLAQRYLVLRPEDKPAADLLERANRHAQPGALSEQELADWTGVVVMQDK